jgi:Ca-activated chloride channel family protein
MDLNSYGALSPIYISGLALVLMIIFLERRRLRLSTIARNVLKLPPDSEGRFNRSAITIFLATLLIISVIRPYWGVEDIESDTKGSDIIFLVDVSRSMYASDLSPSRMEVAKRKMKDLSQLFSRSGAVSRFGITVFAGDGYTVCPVTNDQGVLNQFIDITSPELVTSLGSNLKAGITVALERLDSTTKRSSRLILISDGEDDFFNQTEVVGRIRQDGVPLDVIGVGTLAGSSVTLPTGETIVDKVGRAVITQLNEDSLKALAAAGGGRYVRATIDDTDIELLAKDVISPDTLSLGSGSIQKTTIRTYREFGPWITLLAVVILVLIAGSKRINPLV